LIPWNDASKLVGKALENTAKLVNWYIKPDNDIPFCRISLKDINLRKIAAGDFSGVNKSINKAFNEFKVVYNMPLLGSFQNKPLLQKDKNIDKLTINFNNTKNKDIFSMIGFDTTKIKIRTNLTDKN